MTNKTLAKALGISFGFCLIAGIGGCVVNKEISNFVWGDRPTREVSASEANHLCSYYLGDICQDAEMQFIEGNYREGWLVGGTSEIIFSVDPDQRERAVRTYTELANYDLEKRGVRKDGMYVFIERVGEDRLELVFTDN